MLTKRLNNSVTDMFDGFFNGVVPPWNAASSTSITDFYKLEEKEEGLIFEKIILGVPKEDVDIQIKEDSLYIKYKVPEATKYYYPKDEVESHYNLRNYSSKVDIGKAEAKLENGLLRITVPYLKDKMITKKIKIT